MGINLLIMGRGAGGREWRAGSTGGKAGGFQKVCKKVQMSKKLLNTSQKTYKKIKELLKNEYKTSTQAASIEVLLAQAKQKDAQ